MIAARTLRTLGCLLAMNACTTLVPMTAQADSEFPRDGAAHHSAAHLAGIIVAVDYQRSLVRIDTRRRGVITAYILPSTTIISGDHQYGAISDIRVGESISADATNTDGIYELQYLELR